MPPLFRKREIWWPTWLGATCLSAFLAALGLTWWFAGESFLSPNSRASADVLIVEGWISDRGIRAAADEFRASGYRYIVTTGGLDGEAWGENRKNYAEEAERELLKAGISRDQIIVARSGSIESQRTFRMAMAAREALRSREIHPRAINVFTRGAHGRRSWKVYSKVLDSKVSVGIISWMPPGYETERWWHSSDRADDMLKESVGYLYELLLNSGRSSSSAPATKPAP